MESSLVYLLWSGCRPTALSALCSASLTIMSFIKPGTLARPGTSVSDYIVALRPHLTWALSRLFARPGHGTGRRAGSDGRESRGTAAKQWHGVVDSFAGGRAADSYVPQSAVVRRGALLRGDCVSAYG